LASWWAEGVNALYQLSIRDVFLVTFPPQDPS
jgi:hypothetical protein